MTDLVKKYAKDLQPGDKINGHEHGWLTVEHARRIHLSDKTEIKFCGSDTIHTLNSHCVFEDVITEI